MSKFRDPVYLATDQYRDAGKLNARIQLHEQYSTNPYGWFRWVFDQFDLSPEAHILEMGCGSGMLWYENLSRLPKDWHIVLSDLSSGMVVGCYRNLSSGEQRFDFEICDATYLPFLADSFDAVIADHMLYHLLDRPLALAEITRVLKPESTFYATTNGENHMRELDDLIKQMYQSTGGLFQEKPSSEFCLENGAIQLAPWFQKVEVRYYRDSLKVTDAEPLLAYIYSMIPGSEALAESTLIEDFDRLIREMIQQNGSIEIQKSSGLFIAKKRGPA